MNAATSSTANACSAGLWRTSRPCWQWRQQRLTSTKMRLRRGSLWDPDEGDVLGGRNQADDEEA